MLTRRYLGLWTATAALLMLAFGLCWRRGPYLDDYALRDLACDVVTGQRYPIWSRHRIDTFPIRTLNWAVAGAFAANLPEHEAAVRAAGVLLVILNAGLLAGLVHRVLRSRLAALTAGWLYLAPFPGHEALLWAGAAGYLVAACLALVSMHCCMSALRPGRRRWLPAVLGLAAVVVSFFVNEQAVVMAGTLPLFVACAHLAGPPADPGANVHAPRRWRRLALSSAALMAMMIVLVGAVAFWCYGRETYVVHGRGGFTKTPAAVVDRCGEFLRALYLWTISPTGREMTREALRAGRYLQKTPGPGLALLVAFIASVGWLAVCWRTRPSDYHAPASAGGLLAAAAVGGFLLVLLFPAVLVRGQGLEHRMLYIPSAFAARAAAALVWLVGKALMRSGRTPPWEKAALVTLAVGAWLSATCTAGYADAYARRSRLDSEQLAAAKRTLTRVELSRGVTLVPFGHDALLGTRRQMLSAFFYGVFETPYTVYPELSRILGHREFGVVVSDRTTGMCFAPTTTKDGSQRLEVNGRPIPTADTVLFTCRGGRALVVDELTVRRPDGGDTTFCFPLARRLAEAGAPFMSAAVDGNVPQFELRPR
ncbi:MAG: hypothetical protein AMXMBFR83_29900 [Phycisphaerae bacterium]